MRNRMIDKNMIEEGLALPNTWRACFTMHRLRNFGVSYNSTVADCVNWLLETDRTQLVQVPANGYAGGTLDMPAVGSGVLAFDSA